MRDITQILRAIDAGDAQAADQLWPLVYDELRRLAATQLAREKPGQTLDATALVHEAYLRMVRKPTEADEAATFANRRHFFAVAGQAMRRILVDNARRKASLKHGGGHRRVELEDPAAATSEEEVLALDDALDRLACEDPIAARVVELRHFAGLGHEQVAEALGITVYVTRQKWIYAKAWLHDALGQG